MEKWKKTAKKIFFLPPLATILIAVPSLTLCFVLLSMEAKGILAYLSYGMAAYSLVVLSTGLPEIVCCGRRWIEKNVKSHPLMKKIMQHPLGRRYLTDGLFRAHISLYPGFVINLIYIMLKLSVGISSRSIWLVALAFYYILLALMRFFLLHHAGRAWGRYAVRVSQIPSVRHHPAVYESGIDSGGYIGRASE